MEIEQLAYDLDVVWVAVAAAMVFLMQMGFALVEAGLVRAKNVGNIIAKNLADMAIGSVSYWAVGAAIAYGASQSGLFGTSGFGDPEAILGDGVQFVFQMVFAATAATIVSGAVAERMRFGGYLVVSLAITAVIYPVVTHWQWGGGWLAQLGFHDFAGSALVHLVGGTAGLVGVLFLGPRLGKYAKDGTPRAIPGHNIPFVGFGVFVLWFGWFGFNGGSTLGAQGQGEAIGHILLTTNLAAGAGALAAAAVIWVVAGKPDPAMAGNGALAGLVGITAAPDLASGASALVVGLLAGALVVGSVLLLDRLRVDDPVGAISVHGTCGILGTLAVPFHPGAADAGITLATQAVGVVAIIGFVGATASLLFAVLRATVGIRVTAEVEVEGLDVHEHGVAGYPLATSSTSFPAAPSAAPAPAGHLVRSPAPASD